MFPSEKGTSLLSLPPGTRQGSFSKGFSQAPNSMRGSYAQPLLLGKLSLANTDVQLEPGSFATVRAHLVLKWKEYWSRNQASLCHEVLEKSLPIFEPVLPLCKMKSRRNQSFWNFNVVRKNGGVRNSKSLGQTGDKLKSLGRKDWRWDALDNNRFEELPWIPGNLESHAHAQGRAHT